MKGFHLRLCKSYAGLGRLKAGVYGVHFGFDIMVFMG